MLGDLLRFQPNNSYHADRMTKTVHMLFREQIFLATGIEPEFFLGRDSEPFDRNRFYSLCGYGRPSLDGWVNIVSGKYSNKAAEYFAESVGDSLVISHEAGALAEIMSMTGISYIDMRISPIRFLDDILFCFKTNIGAVSERLMRYQIGCDELQLYANRLKARYYAKVGIDDVGRKMPCAGLAPDSLLICGQSGIDLSLIRDGRVVTMADCAEKLDELIAGHRNVYYKEHPNRGDEDAAGRMLRKRKEVKFTTENLYRMLCDDNLVSVTALSSGALTEARYFGKRVHFLSHEYVVLADDGQVPGVEKYILTRDEYFSPKFWADVLSPCFPVRKCLQFNFTDQGDMMRGIINGWWGYENGHSAGSGTDGVINLLRKAANCIDGERKLRRRLDASGKIRRRIWQFLTR